MSAHKKARTNGREDSGFRNRLTEGQSRRYGIAIKAARPAMTIQSYTKIIAGRKPIVISYDALVSPKHCEWLPIYDFAAELQKAKSKLLHEWDNAAYCPVAISDVGVCLQTRAPLVTLMCIIR
mgnify:CR=1 FL=1